MKRKLLMALLTGTLAVAAPVSCFAETTDAAETETAAASTDETAASDEAEEEADEADKEESAAKKKEELKKIGEKTDDCIAFKLKNGTDKKITGLAIKASDETEFPENMMEADDAFELKEKKKVYFAKETDETTEESTDEVSEDVAPTYDLHLTFEDGTTADVHGVELENLGTLTIHEKEGIVYGT